jgi:glycosyltransferase involved in cell wall biosynthesis
MLHIGFDAKRLFNNFTGLGNYSRSLIDGLNTYYPDNTYYLFSPKFKNNSDTKPFFDNRYKIIKPNTKLKNIWRSITCTKQIKQINLDIFHGLSHELPIGIKKTGVKSIVTMHDLIHKTYPKDFKLIDRFIYNLKTNYACKNADKIIAVSESTKNDIIKLYNIDTNKIEVVYQSCHPNFKTQLPEKEIAKIIKKYNIPENFILYVGSIIERKNLLSIVKAIKKLGDKVNTPLIVIGKGNKYKQKVEKYIEENNLQKKIIFTTNISYADLPAIYQKAKIFIYPSKYEGFGIPIIEALWSRTPVITSNISSLPEAAGDGACYCDPYNYNSIADCILKIINDNNYSNNLVELGLQHVKRFDNHINAEKLISIYNSLIQQK